MTAKAFASPVAPTTACWTAPYWIGGISRHYSWWRKQTKGVRAVPCTAATAGTRLTCLQQGAGSVSGCG